jgi:hypothetical protein
MRRRVVVILIFLLAGAVVNVGVAWGVCLTSDWEFAIEQPLSDCSWITESGGPVTEGSKEEHRDSFGVERRWYTLHIVLDGRRVLSSLFAFYVRTGWPFRCLRGGWWHDEQTKTSRYVDSIELPHTEWVMRTWEGELLPRRIIWPGLALNTIFYTAILWLLIPGPFALRRLIRRRRGQCPACGYDLKHVEHESCPECGAPWDQCAAGAARRR